MKEKEFIYVLEKYLKSIPNEEREEIILDYKIHFRQRKEQGFSEEEIAKQLGSPKSIASEFVVQNFYEETENKKKTVKSKKGNGKLLAKILSLGFVWLTLIFPLLITFVITLFSLLLTGYAIIITSIIGIIGVILKLDFAVSSFPFIGTIFSLIALLSLGNIMIILLKPIFIQSLKITKVITTFTFTKGEIKYE